MPRDARLLHAGRDARKVLQNITDAIRLHLEDRAIRHGSHDERFFVVGFWLRMHFKPTTRRTLVVATQGFQLHMPFRRANKSLEPPTSEKLYDTAVRALARQARSSGEVRQLLTRKKATKSQIEEILHRLRENGYIDDARFARHFAAMRVEGNLHGKARVRRDLAARHLKPQIADEAVKNAFEDVNETELLRQYLQRKVHISKPLSKPTVVAALHRRLLRAGFSSATIVQELKRMLQSPAFKARAADGEEPSWDELLDSLSEVPETETEN